MNARPLRRRHPRRAEIDELTATIGEDDAPRALRQRADLAVGRPEDPVAEAQPPGDLRARPRKILSSTSYLVYRLTGHFVIDHYTRRRASARSISSTSADWSDALAADIIELERLPGSRLDHRHRRRRSRRRPPSETGLAAGTPVIVGTIDAAAEALSVGVLDAGDMMLDVRLDHLHHHAHGERVRDPRLWYAPWLFPGQHAVDGGAGDERHAHPLVPRPVRPRPRPADGDAGARRRGRGIAAGRARAWCFLPYFSGERTPIHDPHAKGVLFGLNLTHTRADIYRALLEGIACGTNHIIETYRRGRPGPARHLRGRRRHQEPGLGAGDVGRVGLHADRAREDRRRLLRRRISRRARGRRREAGDDPRLESGRDGICAYCSQCRGVSSAISCSSASSIRRRKTSCGRSTRAAWDDRGGRTRRSMPEERARWLRMSSLTSARPSSLRASGSVRSRRSRWWTRRSRGSRSAIRASTRSSIIGFDERPAKAKRGREARSWRGDALGPLHGVPSAIKDLFDFKPGWPTTFGGIRALRNNIAQVLLPVRRAHRKGRRHPRRQDQRAGHGLSRHLRQLSLRPDAQSLRHRHEIPAAHPAAAPPRSPTDCCRSPKVPTPAARSASPPPGAASMATRPPSAACRSSSGRTHSPATCRSSSRGRSRARSRTRRWRSACSPGYDPRDPSASTTRSTSSPRPGGRSRGMQDRLQPELRVFPVDRAGRRGRRQGGPRFRGGRRPCRGSEGRHQAAAAGAQRPLVPPHDAAQPAGARRLEARAGLDLLKDHRDDLPPRVPALARGRADDDDSATSTATRPSAREVYDAFQAVLQLRPARHADAGLPAGRQSRRRQHSRSEQINGETVDPLIGWCLTYPINFTGHPAASIPAGMVDELPVGMQIIGRRYADGDVLAASAAFERLRPWQDAYRICTERPLAPQEAADR